MNIKNAKAEIIHTVNAYTAKNEWGGYEIPAVRQRPVLLMGPPGIGKTAIMEQIARECGIGLVAYTITHHTRQSAVGLPLIEKKLFGGKEYAVTEYTMSEIIGSVYECIELTGYREGILFIDEINCVSETLAPTMLQFLQCKTFGGHKVPEGWIIVSAGNPPEYNKSVREFDIVTLDRVKLIEVEADYQVWKEYACQQGIHGAVLSYLNIRSTSFYYLEILTEGKYFVTPRGWEDLSRIIIVYEKLGIPVNEALIGQYLQHAEIAHDFAGYYQLYEKYCSDYRIDVILEGTATEDELVERLNFLEKATFDERCAVTFLILDKLGEYLKSYEEADNFVKGLHHALARLKEQKAGKEDSNSIAEAIRQLTEGRKHSLKVKTDRGLILPEEDKTERHIIHTLESYDLELRKRRVLDYEVGFNIVKGFFETETVNRNIHIQSTSAALERSFSFLERAFGGGQEMVVFITELSGDERSSSFIQKHGCEPYFKFSKALRFKEKEEEMLEQIQSLQEQLTLWNGRNGNTGKNG